MAKVLVVYYSRSGTTEKMAKIISESISKEGIDCALKKLADIKADDLLNYDGILIGSPTYYGTMSWEVKKLFDDSVKFHGKLEGKAGGAFSSSANIAGGNETTVLNIIDALLIHGFIIQGDPKGDHYGPVAIGNLDERATRECIRFGQRFARLVKKIS